MERIRALQSYDNSIYLGAGVKISHASNPCPALPLLDIPDNFCVDQALWDSLGASNQLSQWDIREFVPIYIFTLNRLHSGRVLCIG